MRSMAIIRRCKQAVGVTLIGFAITQSAASPILAPALAFGCLLLITSWSDSHDSTARGLVVALCGFLALRYHWFRVRHTLSAPVRAEFLFADLLYGLELATDFFAWRSTRAMVRRTNRSAQVRADLDWYADSPRAPLVDILIPTYDESMEILEPTILAALGQDYPRFRVWVLDDGDRDWLRSACDRLGAAYLRRENKANFKAGNLNHALQVLAAQAEPPDFLALADADFILLPNFLRRTMALMKDPRVAIVQTPQRFYNPDPFQYAFKAQLAWPDDLRAFFEFRLPALDARGLANCCGTSFLLRFSAALEVGGFPTESLAEDSLLSIKLRGLAWQTIYLQEGLSFGLSPEGMDAFLIQRTRSWLGGMQTALLRWRSLGRRWAWGKRLAALEPILRYILLPPFRIAWLFVPILFWTSGVALVRISSADFIAYVAPLWAGRLAISWMSDGAVLPIVGDAAVLVASPLYVRAVFRAVFHSAKQRFEVTPKGGTRPRVAFYWPALTWLSGIAALLVGSAAYRFIGHTPSIGSSPYLLWNEYATCVALLLLLVAIVPCIERRKHRRAERMQYDRPVTLVRGEHRHVGTARDISLGGALIVGADVRQLQGLLQVELAPDVRIAARVVRALPGRGVAVEFLPSDVDKARLVSLVFGSAQYVNEPASWSALKCMTALMHWFFSLGQVGRAVEGE